MTAAALEPPYDRFLATADAVASARPDVDLAVAMSATLPGRTYGLGLIKEPLRAELGISDLRFNVLNFWAIVIGAACVIPIGRLIDKLGTRLVLGGVAAALGGCAAPDEPCRRRTELAISLTLVRGFGLGCVWWSRSHSWGSGSVTGIAMGAFAVLLAVGFVVPIFVVEAAVESVGWRTAWAGVGWVLILGLVPLGLLFARASPEACGVAPDEPARSGPSR